MRIIIRRINPPQEKELDRDIGYLVESMGLQNGRDLDGMSFKILRELLKQTVKCGHVRAGELAIKLNVPVGRINHHLRQLIESGLVVRERARLCLRGGTMRRTIEEMKADVDRYFEDLLKVSEDIDKAVGFQNRF